MSKKSNYFNVYKLKYNINNSNNSNSNKDLVECSGGPGGRHNDRNERYPKTFDLNELVNKTKFTKSDIKFIYRDFKSVCQSFSLFFVL